MFHAFEKAYGNIENGDSHRYEKALKEGLCGEPDTGKESSSYNRHYVWTEENYHTADGATTKKLHYAYDVYNRNVSVTGDDFTQKNHYDAEGYRDSITEKDKVTNFVYQGGMLLHELDEDKNPARHYILGNEYISQVDGTSFGYYLNDEQGSAWYLTGSDGSIRNHYRYSAFGETITAEETVPNRLRYNGQMADGLTGLYYLRARYYNASLGRFTQEDVIYNDGLNLYAYCNSNPVMYSDPSGFTKQCDPKVGGEKDSKSGSKAIGTDELVVRDTKFLDADGNIDWEKWAPNGGRVPGTIKENQTIPAGTIIDRYGSQWGKYTSPAGVPYEQRALPYIENPNAYHKYEVLKQIDNVTISEIAPAFEQVGGGIQYELPNNIKKLKKLGYIKEIK